MDPGDSFKQNHLPCEWEQFFLHLRTELRSDYWAVKL